MNLYDVTSEHLGDAQERVEAPTAEDAATSYAAREMLPSGSRVTVRELSGSRERRVFRVVGA